MSPTVKVTNAFPPSAEVRVMEEQLRARLAPSELDAFDKSLRQRMELRALTCTQGLSIGRLDSVASVGALPVNRDCFNEQDSELVRYLGLRQIAMLLKQPPLRPILPLGAPKQLSTAGGPSVHSGDSASDAGVVVLRGTRGEYLSIEIPGGAKIASIPTIVDAYQRVFLSPNGRIAAIGIGRRSLMFVDVERGAKIFEDSNVQQFLAWLPDLSAALVLAAQKSEVVTMDFERGVVEVHGTAAPNPAWAIPLDSDQSRVLIGKQKAFSIIDHARTAVGIQSSIVRSFEITQGPGVTSSPPTLMKDGKAIVFVAGRNLGLVDLETGAESLWPIDRILANRYAKLSETTLLMDAYVPGGVGTKAWVFDIEAATLSRVESEVGQSGLLMELSGRTGYMRRGYQSLWVGGEVATGAPESFEVVLQSLQAEQALASAAANERRADASHSREVYEATERRRIELRGPPNTPPGAASRSFGGIAGNSAATVPIGSGAFADLATDAKIEAVGVYEGGGAKHGPGQPRIPGTVEINVRTSSAPILLVVSSYEPVIWRVNLMPGAELAGVLYSGYHDSTVIGAGSARKADLGQIYCYEAAKCNALQAAVKRVTGKSIDNFQGRYEGTSFSVGGF